MSIANETIGKLIKAAGKSKSQLAGDYMPVKTDSHEKVAIEGGMKPEGEMPMKTFSSDKVIQAVNAATDLDAKLKAYTSASGYNTLNANPSSTAPKS